MFFCYLNTNFSFKCGFCTKSHADKQVRLMRLITIWRMRFKWKIWLRQICKFRDSWFLEWNAIKLKLKTPEAPRPWLILSEVACAFIALVIIEKVSELNTFKTRKRPPRPYHYSIRLRLSGYVVYWAFASLHGGSLENTLTVIDSAGIWNLPIEKWCLRRKEYL